MNSAFDTLDSFFLFEDGNGVHGISQLASLGTLFDGVTFTVRSDGYLINSFTFTADRGFTSLDLAKVPEPGTFALVVLAALGLAGAMRRPLRG